MREAACVLLLILFSYYNLSIATHENFCFGLPTGVKSTKGVTEWRTLGYNLLFHSPAYPPEEWSGMGYPANVILYRAVLGDNKWNYFLKLRIKAYKMMVEKNPGDGPSESYNFELKGWLRLEINLEPYNGKEPPEFLKADNTSEAIPSPDELDTSKWCIERLAIVARGEGVGKDPKHTPVYYAGVGEFVEDIPCKGLRTDQFYRQVMEAPCGGAPPYETIPPGGLVIIKEKKEAGCLSTIHAFYRIDLGTCNYYENIRFRAQGVILRKDNQQRKFIESWRSPVIKLRGTPTYGGSDSWPTSNRVNLTCDQPIQNKENIWGGTAMLIEHNQPDPDPVNFGDYTCFPPPTAIIKPGKSHGDPEVTNYIGEHNLHVGRCNRFDTHKFPNFAFDKPDKRFNPPFQDTEHGAPEIRWTLDISDTAEGSDKFKTQVTNHSTYARLDGSRNQQHLCIYDENEENYSGSLRKMFLKEPWSDEDRKSFHEALSKTQTPNLPKSFDSETDLRKFLFGPAKFGPIDVDRDGKQDETFGFKEYIESLQKVMDKSCEETNYKDDSKERPSCPMLNPPPDSVHYVVDQKYHKRTEDPLTNKDRLLGIQFRINPILLNIWDTRVLHGVFMVIVTFLLVPLNSLISRYYKETYMDYHITYLRVWYFVHHNLIGFMACFIVVGIFRQARHGNLFGGPRDWISIIHVAMGYMAILIFVFLLIGGGFRPMNRSIRSVVIGIHWAFSLSFYLLCLACVTTAFFIPGSPIADFDVTVEYEDDIQINTAGLMMLFFIIGDIAANVFLSIQLCQTDKYLQLSRPRWYFPVPIPVVEEHCRFDVPGTKARTTVLALYASLCLFTTIFMAGWMTTMEPGERRIGRRSCTHSRGGTWLAQVKDIPEDCTLFFEE